MVLAGLSACGGSSPATPAAAANSPSVASTSTGVAPSASDAPVAVSPSPVGDGAVPACTLADIKATLTEQPQRREGDTRMALVHLLNASNRTCTVGGWPEITLANAADEAVTAPTMYIAMPGESVPADLAPGGGAFAGIKWTICDKAAADCPTGNTVKVGLAKGGPFVAATLEGFPNPAQSGITFGSLKVGTIQPSNQGVVAW
jgi:hypothetical protein